MEKQKQLARPNCAIRSFPESKERLFGIADELELLFKQLAPSNNVRVLRGTRGNLPRIERALEMLLQAWDATASDKKPILVREYVQGYIENIRISRPECLLRPLQPPQPTTAEAPEAEAV